MPLTALRWRWMRPWWRRLPQPVRLIDRLSNSRDAVAHVLFQEADTGIAVVNHAGRLVRVNDALRRMVDRGCDLAPGMAAAEMFSSARREEAWAELLPVIEGRRVLRPMVATLRGKGAEGEQAVRISALSLREADGSVSGALLQLTDISAEKRLEAQLSHGQKLQAVGQLAGGIAHDFNNLLTAMIGAADDIKARQPADAETREDVEQIRSSAERGAALVKQLLAFGRQQTLQPQIVDINGAVEALCGLLKRLLGSRVRLELALEHPGCQVCVDPTQLDQVVINLAVNARDAMPEGGTLTLHSGHVTLFRALGRGEELIPPGRYVMLEVEDTGVGMPPELLSRIFDPFFTTRRDQGGSGLGLSTVHGIIRQSNGYLAVDSSIGKGTRFRIYLPRHDGEEMSIPRAPATHAEASPAAAPAQLAPPGGTPEGRWVLLVDDEESIRRLALRALTNDGWSVLAADSGEAALALMEEDGALDKLSAVVSDVVMPGMDGAALVRELRRRRPGLPAILASGYAEEAVRADIKGEHDVLFLPKPYKLRTMVDAVARTARADAAAPVKGPG